MTSREVDWDTSLIRYASTVELGGTNQERAWAWARANQALDHLCGTTPAAKHDTIEIEAVTKQAA